jgi:hypothetical protein
MGRDGDIEALDPAQFMPIFIRSPNLSQIAFDTYSRGGKSLEQNLSVWRQSRHTCTSDARRLRTDVSPKPEPLHEAVIFKAENSPRPS